MWHFTLIVLCWQLEQERQILLAERQSYHQSVLDRYNLQARRTAQVPTESIETDDKNLMEDLVGFVYLT